MCTKRVDLGISSISSPTPASISLYFHTNAQTNQSTFLVDTKSCATAAAPVNKWLSLQRCAVANVGGGGRAALYKNI